MSTAINQQTGAHQGHWTTTATQSGTYEFNTGGKYVDRNIDLVVPQAQEEINGEITSSTASATVTATVGTKSGSNYPITGSGDITGTVSGTAKASIITKGFTDSTEYTGNISGDITGTASVSGSIPAIGLGITDPKNVNGTITTVSVGTKSNNTYPITGSKATSGTVTAKVTSSGYGKTNTETGSGTVSGTATLNSSLPAIGLSASGNATGSLTLDDSAIGAYTNSKYPIGADNNVSLSGTATAVVTSDGYGKSDAETGTGDITGTATAKGQLSRMAMTAGNSTVNASKVVTRGEYKVTTSGYIKTSDATTQATGKLAAATFANTAANGVTYVDISDAKVGSTSGSYAVPVLKSGDYLYINKGYVDNLKISLARLVPDSVDSANGFAGSAQMLAGYSLFDKDGNPVTGEISTNTGESIYNTSNVVYVPSGFYSDLTSYTIPDAGSLSLSTTITAANSTVASTATSGYYNISNTVNISGSHSSAGWASTSANTASETSKIVGRVVASTITGSDKSVTASASATAYDTTSNLTSGTYATSATTGYTYHIDSSASASVDTQTATKTVSSGYYPSQRTATATVTGANKSSTSKVYLKDSTSSATSGSTLALGSTLTIGKGYYPTDRTFIVPSGSGALGNTSVTEALTNSITSGYNATTIYSDNTGLSAYITLNAEATGYTTGKILESVTTPDTKYIEVFTGTFSIT